MSFCFFFSHMTRPTLTMAMLSPDCMSTVSSSIQVIVRRLDWVKLLVQEASGERL